MSWQKIARRRTRKLAGWKPGEAFEFEKAAETEPQTAPALRRLTDMQYDVLHDDFQQGETLAGLEVGSCPEWTVDRSTPETGTVLLGGA